MANQKVGSSGMMPWIDFKAQKLVSITEAETWELL